jgi:CBS domain-containing protein
MQVSEIMHSGVVTAQINDSLKRVATLMKKQDIGSVPIYKDQRPVGFVTDRDIVLTCVANGHSPDEPISLAMSQNIFSIYENQDISEALKLMEEKQISRLLVLDTGDTPVGMVSLKDLVRRSNEVMSEVLSEIKRS